MPWIDDVDVRQYLHKPTSGNGPDPETFIDAACTMIEDIKGHVDLVSLDETHLIDRRTDVVTLNEGPVIAVTAVSLIGPDGIPVAIPAQDIPNGVVYGYRVVDRVVHVPRWGAGTTYGESGYWNGMPEPALYRGAYHITYQAGVDPVPPNYTLAALELVAHFWRTSQLQSGGRRAPAGDTDMDWARGMAYALPFRVRELLGLYGTQVTSAGFVIA